MPGKVLPSEQPWVLSAAGANRGQQRRKPRSKRPSRLLRPNSKPRLRRNPSKRAHPTLSKERFPHAWMPADTPFSDADFVPPATQAGRRTRCDALRRNENQSAIAILQMQNKSAGNTFENENEGYIDSMARPRGEILCECQ